MNFMLAEVYVCLKPSCPLSPVAVVSSSQQLYSSNHTPPFTTCSYLPLCLSQAPLCFSSCLCFLAFQVAYAPWLKASLLPHPFRFTLLEERPELIPPIFPVFRKQWSSSKPFSLLVLSFPLFLRKWSTVLCFPWLLGVEGGTNIPA